MNRRSVLLTLASALCFASIGMSQAPAWGQVDPDLIPDWGSTTSSTPATVTSTKSGNWSATGTPKPWAGTPSSTTVVRINSTHTITVDGTTPAARIIYVSNGATLRFNTGINTKLTANTIYVAPGGTLEIGTATVPVASGFTAQLSLGGAMMTNHATPTAANYDPNQHSAGLIVLGKLITCGQQKTPFSNCTSANLTLGTTSVSLNQDPNYGSTPYFGWKSGDVIGFPDTRSIYKRRKLAYTPNEDVSTNPDPVSYSEVQSLGADPNSNTITLTKGLAADHLGNTLNGANLTPWILNLSRNVRIYSTSLTSNRRAHIIVQDSGTADLRYTELLNLGRTTTPKLDNTANGTNTNNHVGRYALHFHHNNGSVASPITVNGIGYRSVVIGCAFNNSPKWLMVIHNSTKILAQDNALYDAQGAAVVTETGGECWNDIVHNFAAKCSGGLVADDYEDNGSTPPSGNIVPGKRAERTSNGSDFGSEGVGFWLSGSGNLIKNNIAADCSFSGFLTFQHYTSEQTFPTAPEDPEENWVAFQFPEYYTVNNWTPYQYNTAFACGRGIEIWKKSAFRLLGTTAWNCHIGIVCREAEKLTVEDSYVRGDDYKSTYNPGNTGSSFSEDNESSYLYARPSIGIDNHYHVVAARFLGMDIANTGIGVLTHSPTGVVAPGGYTDLLYKVTNDAARYVRDLVIQYGQYRCDAGIVVIGDLHYKKTYENSFVDASRVYIQDCHFYPRVSTPWFAIRPLLSMTGDKNVLAPDEIWVGNYQGLTGYNYRIYYDAQAPGVIVPHSSPYRGVLRDIFNQSVDYITYNGSGVPWIEGLENATPQYIKATNSSNATVASPIIGLTNLQAWSSYGKAIAGSVAPSTAGPLNDMGGLVVAVGSLPALQSNTYIWEGSASSYDSSHIDINFSYPYFWEMIGKVDIYVNGTKINATPLAVDQYDDGYPSKRRKLTYYFSPTLAPGSSVVVKIANGQPWAGDIIP